MTEEIKQRIETIKAGKVPDGYKRTVVGIVPNDVQGKGLGDSVFDGEIGHGPIDFVVELQCPNCGLLNTVPIPQLNQKRTEIGSF